MSNLPIRRAQFRTEDFLSWLAQMGAEIGKPTNPYEVVRYRAYSPWGKAPNSKWRKAATHIVYAKENGLLTFCGDSAQHYDAFINGDSAGVASPALKSPGTATVSRSQKQREALLRRDGDECWYCGKPLAGDMTLEHLVNKSDGGRDRLDNFALAHGACNRLAANRPLVQKIVLRTEMRAALEQIASE